MEKLFRAGIRRETPDLIHLIQEKYKWTHEQLATEMGCTVFTISRWVHGHSAPSSKDFERLKSIASGQSQHGKQDHQSIDVLMALGELKGMISSRLDTSDKNNYAIMQRLAKIEHDCHEVRKIFDRRDARLIEIRNVLGKLEKKDC